MSRIDPPPDDRPPFIADQGMSFLREQVNVKKHIGMLAISGETKSRDDGIHGGPEQAADRETLGHWDPVSPAQVAYNSDPDRPLGKMVVVNQAGMGKSTRAQWLRWRYSDPSSDKVAFCIDVSRLKDLVANQAQAPRAMHLTEVFQRHVLLHELSLPPRLGRLTVDPEDGMILLRRLIGAGRAVLIFDGLDHASDQAVEVLARLLEGNSWSVCRIIITSRPYALDQHWARLFGSPEEAPGWRFVRLEEFTGRQQEAYLGPERSRRIPPDARDILNIPRVLYYLRKLTLKELADVQTSSDVYYLATQRMIGEALNADHTGSLTSELATRLLSMIAFHMVSSDARFDAVHGTGPLAKLRGSLCTLCAAYAHRMNLVGTYDETWVTNRLNELAAMNDILDCGLPERGCPNHYQFRNRSLQEFFAAQFMACYCTEHSLPRVEQILYWEANGESQRYRNVWWMFAKMSHVARDSTSWLTAASVLYRPGTGNPVTTRRSTEMIYHTWTSVKAYESDGDELVAAQATEILVNFQAEFARICEWRRIFRGWWGWLQWWTAIRLIGGFVRLPASRDSNGAIWKSLRMHRYTVTNAQYELFDPGHKRTDVSRWRNCPVVAVSWYDAWVFARWCGHGCFLPTEKEWEYACRAGSTRDYCFGDDDFEGLLEKYAWYNINSGGRAHPVGWKRPNAWGLYDMHGNVWEWCDSWYKRSSRARVLRGGSWRANELACQSSFQIWDAPEDRVKIHGFRIVATVDVGKSSKNS